MPSPAPTPPRSTTPILQERRPPSRGVFEPGARIGSWRVVRILGQGATGIVYEVEHCTLRTRRALKVLTWAHPMLQARLLTEGRAQAALLHPNVVAVLDMLSIGEVPALLMELVDGPSLDAWLDEHDPTPDEAEAIFRGILGAVETAHAAGLIHRDLKPANVLMAPVEGGGWVPKVTDFGLAKDAHSDLGLTRTGMTMGTPGYMAPEQIRSPRDVDQRADIFALGCIFYQLLTGIPPHEGPDALTVMNAVTDGQVTRVDRARPGLPRRVVQAVRAAMAVEPDDRPDDCAGLRTLLDGRPRPAPAESTWGWRVWLVLSVVMAVVGVGGIVASLTLAAISVQRAQSVHETSATVALPAAELPEAPTIVIPEPWVPDDVDPTLVPLDLSADEPVDAPDAQARLPIPGSSTEPGPCARGWIRLPWLARSPEPGPWPLKRDLELYADPSDSSPACEILDGSEVTVVKEAVKVDGSRFVEVVVR